MADVTFCERRAKAMSPFDARRLRARRVILMLGLGVKQPGIDDGRHVLSLLPEIPGGQID
jgi:hypothetical protein